MTRNLAELLANAEADAAHDAAVLAGLEGKFAAAVRGEDFATAERIKTELPEARQVWALAEAQAKALTEVIAQLDRERAERDAAAGEDARRRQARAQVDAALAGEKAALDAMYASWAQVAPGLDAVRAAMADAVAAEQAAGHHRQAAHDALVALGEREPSRVGAPNHASAQIEASPLLVAIRRGRG